MRNGGIARCCLHNPGPYIGHDICLTAEFNIFYGASAPGKSVFVHFTLNLLFYVQLVWSTSPLGPLRLSLLVRVIPKESPLAFRKGNYSAPRRHPHPTSHRALVIPQRSRFLSPAEASSLKTNALPYVTSIRHLEGAAPTGSSSERVLCICSQIHLGRKEEKSGERGCVGNSETCYWIKAVWYPLHHRHR